MNLLKLSEIAKITQGKLIGEDLSVMSISNDTRTIKPNDLYIAIKGEKFNGNQFVEEAKKQGAIAALVADEGNYSLPVVLVKDTRIALGLLAKHQRHLHQIPMIAVTGSSGKTTTKAMMAAIMAVKGQVLATEGTRNNDIGMPLTLLDQNATHEFAVIEMGTNHFGEISYLTNIAKPDVVVITLIGPAHLEALGNLEGVVKAKSEIFEGLNSNGIAILNADDPYIEALIHNAKPHKVVLFGVKKPADVFATEIEIDENSYARFNLHIGQQSIPVQLSLPGEHNVMNALAAAAACFQIGANLTEIGQGLSHTIPVAKRMIFKEGMLATKIIDDTYNANPNSVEAALKTLNRCPGEKIFVFGGMGEMGKQSHALHQEIGNLALKYQVDQLYVLGAHAKGTAERFGAKAKFYLEKDELIQQLKASLHSGMTILVKGSRAAKMEDVVTAIIKE